MLLLPNSQGTSDSPVEINTSAIESVLASISDQDLMVQKLSQTIDKVCLNMCDTVNCLTDFALKNHAFFQCLKALGSPYNRSPGAGQPERLSFHFIMYIIYKKLSQNTDNQMFWRTTKNCNLVVRGTTTSFPWFGRCLCIVHHTCLPISAM